MLYDYHGVAVDKENAAKLALEAGVDIELPNTNWYGNLLKNENELDNYFYSFASTAWVL